jgi:selenide,water dikinase
LSSFRQKNKDNNDVLVGLDSPDDGGVIQLPNGSKIVQTVDFFTPILDDPYDWGRVAATNALSDIYAMGGQPISALQLVSWPRDEIGFDILSKVIEGGADVMASASCSVIGGHSIEDKEPKYGFAVTGIINDKIYTKSNVQIGDKLYLSKPIGSGIISSAIKKGIASDSVIQEVTEIMTELNDRALELAKQLDANAITDITGFGLLGHLSEMIKDDSISAEIFSEKVPVLDSAQEYFENGIFSSGSQRNYDSISSDLSFEKELLDTVKLFSDAQTSGGLLMSVPDSGLNEIEEFSKNYNIKVWEIGRITSRYNGKINII